LVQETTGSPFEAVVKGVLYDEGAASVYFVMDLIVVVATGLFVEKFAAIP
jgi:hypothetical protein